MSLAKVVWVLAGCKGSSPLLSYPVIIFYFSFSFSMSHLFSSHFLCLLLIYQILVPVIFTLFLPTLVLYSSYLLSLLWSSLLVFILSLLKFVLSVSPLVFSLSFPLSLLPCLSSCLSSPRLLFSSLPFSLLSLSYLSSVSPFSPTPPHLILFLF